MIQIGDVNIFVHRGVISVLHFHIKCDFPNVKNTHGGT